MVHDPDELISFKGYSYACHDCKKPLAEISVREYETETTNRIYLCTRCYNNRTSGKFYGRSTY